MNNIKISLNEVNECAVKIRSANQLMYDLLTQMKNDMNQTNVSWISDGGEAIRTKFNQFANRFEIQKEIIESYARFLDQTVSSYDTLETTITSNATNMQS